MSFNRLMYDYCEGKKSLLESTGPGNYMNNTPVICGNCLQTDPNIIPNRTGASMNSNVPWRFYAGPIDVESELLNLNRAASKCPGNQYKPDCNGCSVKNQGQPCGAGVISGVSCDKKIEGFTNQNNQGKVCPPNNNNPGQRCSDNNLVSFPNCYFGTVNSRLNNPPSSLKGTGINRFTPLCLDPQANIFFPGEYQIPSRQVIRDNHRPCIPSLKTISQAPLPPAEKPPCPETVKTCGVFTAPMYQYDVCG